ncbi:Uncharacterised protein [Mycobacteroides abscessus subsp. abscessus]|nr:Uncharacterised protein [Mycobacteroides abscessus subsp. abscessus]SIN56688.1 Uncharacterised protein [Mycobacteroides abscessus subsp. abscessus]
MQQHHRSSVLRPGDRDMDFHVACLYVLVLDTIENGHAALRHGPNPTAQ